MLDSQCKGSNARSIRSPVANEERIMPGHWLGLVFPSFLTPMVGWQEGHPARENLIPLMPGGSFLEQA